MTSVPRQFAAAIVILAFLASGCLVTNYTEGFPINVEKLPDIQPGVTKKQEIVEWFGPPSNYSNPSSLRGLFSEAELNEETLSQYQFSDLLTYQYNKGRLRALILGVYNLAEVQFKSDYLVVFFDDNDIVLYHGFHKGTDELR